MLPLHLAATLISILDELGLTYCPAGHKKEEFNLRSVHIL
jgi:hypothetical protein